MNTECSSACVKTLLSNVLAKTIINYNSKHSTGIKKKKKTCLTETDASVKFPTQFMAVGQVTH